MTAAALALLVLVAGQRLVELVISRRHTARLLAEGAYEVGAGHYPLIVAVHAAWLAALAVWAAWQPAPLDPLWVAVYLALQAARLWVMRSLGRYWTTRIIVVPGLAPLQRGPYRFMRHPNYAVVAAEIAVLPLAFGAWPLAVVFSLLNAAVLAVRIRAENATLAARG
jgi:methyltransferase